MNISPLGGRFHSERTGADRDGIIGVAMYEQQGSAIATPKRQPRFHVVLWDDNDHTYDYVIGMTRRLFGFSTEQSRDVAERVDQNGRVICLTTTKEHAELKRDQILAFGKDQKIEGCQGSMSATIEPETSE